MPFPFSEPPVRWQVKYNAGPITVQGLVTGFTFNNLKIGQLYRCSVQAQVYCLGNSVTEDAGFYVRYPPAGDAVCGVGYRSDSGPNDSRGITAGNTRFFVATGTTIQGYVSITGTGRVTEMFATLEEMNNYQYWTGWD